MGDTPTQTNATGNLVVDIISGFESGVAAPTLEGIIEADVPFLAVPVIKQIFEAIFEHYLSEITVEFEDGAVKLVIRAQAGSELAGLIGAANDYSKASKSGDTNAINQATQNIIDGWGNLIHWDGTTATK